MSSWAASRRSRRDPGRRDSARIRRSIPRLCHLEPHRVLRVEEIVVPPLVDGAEEWERHVRRVGGGEELVAPGMSPPHVDTSGARPANVASRTLFTPSNVVGRWRGSGNVANCSGRSGSNIVSIRSSVVRTRDVTLGERGRDGGADGVLLGGVLAGRRRAGAEPEQERTIGDLADARRSDRQHAWLTVPDVGHERAEPDRRRRGGERRRGRRSTRACPSRSSTHPRGDRAPRPRRTRPPRRRVSHPGTAATAPLPG